MRVIPVLATRRTWDYAATPENGCNGHSPGTGRPVYTESRIRLVYLDYRDEGRCKVLRDFSDGLGAVTRKFD